MEGSALAEAPKKRVVCGPEKADTSTVARGRKSSSEVTWDMMKDTG